MSIINNEIADNIIQKLDNSNNSLELGSLPLFNFEKIIWPLKLIKITYNKSQKPQLNLNY